MKWKMSDKSLFALLLRSPWWISIAVFAGFALLARALLPPAYVWTGLFGGLPFLVIGVIAARRQWLAPKPAQLAQQLRPQQLPQLQLRQDLWMPAMWPS